MAAEMGCWGTQNCNTTQEKYQASAVGDMLRRPQVGPRLTGTGVLS